ncbi:MAG: hypothetical protein BGO31_12070 [Bacteroidetes bacterium 43-16]|nr:MAG: hypothetical protein BGO31_12070 [Bacteroidetes bacterium 43-16]
MKNILAIIAIAASIQLAIMVSAHETTGNNWPADRQQFNNQDTVKKDRQSNPKNNRSNTRDKTNMPPDIRTDTARVPPPPFDTLSNPSSHRRT